MFCRAALEAGENKITEYAWQDFKESVLPYVLEGSRRRIYDLAQIFFRKRNSIGYALILEPLPATDEGYEIPLLKALRFNSRTHKSVNVVEIVLSGELCLEFEFSFADKSKIFVEIADFLFKQKGIGASLSIQDEAKKCSHYGLSSAFAALVDFASSKDFIFLAGGQLTVLQSNSSDSNPCLIDRDCALTVRERNSASELLVFDKGMSQIYRLMITKSFCFYSNTSTNTVSWVDKREGQRLFRFELFKIKNDELKTVLGMCALRMKETKKTKQQKEEKESFFLSTEKIPTISSPILNFQQARSRGLCFVSRGIKTEVFSLEPEVRGGVKFISSLSPILTSEGRPLIPSKMLLFEEDKSLVILDNQAPDKIFYCDVEKEKVVREWKPAETIKDVSSFSGKNSGTEPTLLAVGPQDILKLDARAKHAVVDRHFYRTNYGFEKILGVAPNQFAVSSINGDLRLYSSVTGNAKNVIPTAIPGQVRDLDCSRDGRLLLVTYAKHLLLFRILHEGRSAFEYMFRRVSKPQPLVLTVSPQELNLRGASGVDFRSGKFDEKKETQEKYIVAASGELLVLWNVSEVLQGFTESKQFKITGKSLIGGEFCYNSDDLLVAGSKNLFVQSTRKVPLLHQFH